jgi:hypothetical protein
MIIFHNILNHSAGFEIYSLFIKCVNNSPFDCVVIKSGFVSSGKGSEGGDIVFIIFSILVIISL